MKNFIRLWSYLYMIAEKCDFLPLEVIYMCICARNIIMAVSCETIFEFKEIICEITYCFINIYI